MTRGRRLYFLRHGLADRAAYTGTDDNLRPLTPRGEQRMALSALTMNNLDLGIDLILTSPLTRARQTAEIAAEGMDLSHLVEIDDGLAFGFDLAEVARLLAAWPDRGRIMLVGHEPSFSMVIGDLCDAGRIVCKKGSLARVDLLGTTDRPWGELVWLLQPKVLVAGADVDPY